MTSHTSFKVLLIDDDQTLARMLSEYLSSYGLSVEWAKDAAAGLEKLGAAPPDVVVLDVMLPGLDGFELLPRLRAKSDVPVLMLTARGEDTDRIVGLASSFNRAAERIERLVEAQRTLLAGTSHELRAPLTRIRMAVELMGDRAPADLKARIEREIGDLDELIGELILASRIEARQAMGEEERIDLLALAAEEASRYEATLDGSPVEIRGDRALVRRLIRNLLENARRHAPRSPIDIAVGPANGKGARIQVLDRGAGVAEEEREKIFEPFYSSKAELARDRGVGLGLTLVRRIARYHGGEARCLARPGGGSIFEVDLAGPA